MVTYLDRAILFGLKPTDICFALCFLPLLSRKINMRKIFSDDHFMKIFKFLLVFMIYHVCAYGLLVPFLNGQGGQGFFSFLRYQRLTTFGFLIIVPAYVMILQSPKIFVNLIIMMASAILTIYFIALLTGAELIPIWTFDRYQNSGILRKTMLSYGYINFVTHIALIVLLLKIPIKYKQFAYYASVLMVITIIITLTRQSIIMVFLQLITIVFLLSRYHRVSKMKNMFKFALAGLFVAAVLETIFPNYLGYASQAVGDTYLALTGQESIGIIESRTTNELPLQYALFLKNPIWGTGYMWQWHSNDDSIGGFGGTDTPIMAGLGMFGLIGALFYSIFYIRIMKLLYSIHKNLKMHFSKELLITEKYSTILVVITLVFFGTHIIFKWPALFVELISGDVRVGQAFFLGALLACWRKVRAVFPQES